MVHEQTSIHKNTIIALESIGFSIQKKKATKSIFFMIIFYRVLFKNISSCSLTKNQIISLMRCNDADKIAH